MPAKAKPNKREAILNATLDVVAERGFHEAPMSLISDRADASAGVIYHYFASKEEIIQALYQQVLSLKHDRLLAGYSAELDDRDAFIWLWVNGYRFYREHHREMRFLEQYEAAGFSCKEHGKVAQDPVSAELERRFRGKSKGGVLKDWPPEVIHELTFGVVARLARLAKKLGDRQQREIAEKMWEMLKAEI